MTRKATKQRGMRESTSREKRRMADAAHGRIVARALNQAFDDMMDVELWANPAATTNDLCRVYFDLIAAELKSRRRLPYVRPA